MPTLVDHSALILEGNQGHCSEDNLEMDKCVGPPVYEGLTQAAVLMQLHTHLSVLDEENK